MAPNGACYPIINVASKAVNLKPNTIMRRMRMDEGWRFMEPSEFIAMVRT